MYKVLVKANRSSFLNHSRKSGETSFEKFIIALRKSGKVRKKHAVHRKHQKLCTGLPVRLTGAT